MKLLRINEHPIWTKEEFAKRIWEFIMSNGDGYVNTEDIPEWQRIIDNKERYYALINELDILAVGAVHMSHAMIEKICVRRDRRGRGLGKILLSLLASIIFSSGKMTAYATVRKENILGMKLFESLGFRRVSEDIGHFYYRLEFNEVKNSI
jgi:ribosomal protein S18 acetylase RimI-like enzyme